MFSTQLAVGRAVRAAELIHKFVNPVGDGASPPATQLRPEGAVFFDQIRDDVLLLVIQPAEHRSEKQPDGGDINHGASLHQRPTFEP